MKKTQETIVRVSKVLRKGKIEDNCRKEYMSIPEGHEPLSMKLNKEDLEDRRTLQNLREAWVACGGEDICLLLLKMLEKSGSV